MSQSSIYSRKIHDYSSFKALVDRGITAVTSEMLEGATEIGYAAFQRCSKLTSVEIPNSVTIIDGHAFQSCSSLTSVEIPNSATIIGGYAFDGCTSLSSAEIPDSVTNISICVFRNCTALTSLTIRATAPPSLGASALFNTSSSLKIYVPSESVETYKSASGWSTYASKIQAISEA